MYIVIVRMCMYVCLYVNLRIWSPVNQSVVGNYKAWPHAAEGICTYVHAYVQWHVLAIAALLSIAASGIAQSVYVCMYVHLN